MTVYETTDEGWSWGQLETDGYVGWLPANALDAPGAEPTHKVAALRTLAFPGPDIKLPPIEALPLGARLAVARIEAPFAVTGIGGYVPARHLAPIDASESDFVAVAERFLGTPYLWGGKTSLGLDCSGLVQVALDRLRHPLPARQRHAGSALGQRRRGRALSDLRRGDLVFWKGHVAHRARPDDAPPCQRVSHGGRDRAAREAIARIRASGSEVTSVRRL